MSDVIETLANDGRQVLYSTAEEDETPSETDEWLASDTIVSGSDMQ